MRKTITTQSENETADSGRELARGMKAGDVVLLHGDLGAGKTAFVGGLAEGLGIAREEVSSPTFTLVQEYRGGRLTLFHADLYRLNDPREIDDLGLDEVATEGVLAIEMAAIASDLKLSIHAHPTLSETIMEAAEVFFGQSTHLYHPRRNIKPHYLTTHGGGAASD